MSRLANNYSLSHLFSKLYVGTSFEFVSHKLDILDNLIDIKV